MNRINVNWLKQAARLQRPHSLGSLCLCHLLPLVLENPFFKVSALEFNVRPGQWVIQFNMTLKTLWRCLMLHINDCPDPDWPQSSQLSQFYHQNQQQDHHPPLSDREDI